MLAEILVHNAAHEMLVDGCLERHAMKVSGLELTQRAANIFRPLISSFRTRLPRIVMTDKNRRPFFHRTAMDGNYLVFEDRRVIIEFALENRAVGNFAESCGDFDSAERFDLGIFTAVAGWL